MNANQPKEERQVHQSESNSNLPVVAEDEAADESVTDSLSEVQETVIKNFDRTQWNLTEAILSTHATLFINGIQNCSGLIVVGKSGAGKTTALKFFDGLEEQFYRSDEVTPASFVSHDASLTDEQLAEVDLLPRIQHKSLMCRDMETWFSGNEESIRTTMSRMTHLMDGQGLTRDSGSHGQRGYQGDLRFTFIGASTPLEPRAWRVMGNAGYRFVFYYKESPPSDRAVLKENLFGETNYEAQVSECNEVVQSFLQQLWEEHEGYGGVSDTDISVSDDAQEAIAYLAELVKYCRATLTYNSDDKNPTVTREDPHRVGSVLRDIAKGRALLEERTTVSVDDVAVSARIALSTMPNKRRAAVQTLLDPKNDGRLLRKEVGDALEVSKPTAIERMKLLDSLEIAEFAELDDGWGSTTIELRDELEWPDSLEFPDFGGQQDDD